MNYLFMISRVTLAGQIMAETTGNVTSNSSIDWLSWSGWIIGAVGLIIAFVQIYQAKVDKKVREKEREAEKFLFKIAEQHIDKNIKADEIKGLDKKLSDLQKTIQDEIPKEALRIALKNIIDNEAQMMSESYTKLVAMKEKLNELTGVGDIEDNDLMKNVYKEISPTYSQRRNQQAFSNIFIVISVISSLIGMLIPYEYSRYVLFAVMAIQLTFAILQIRGYLSNNYNKKDRHNLIRVFLPLAAFVFALFTTLITIQVFLGHGFYNIYDALGTFIVVIVFGVSHYVLSAVYLTKMRKKIWLTIIGCVLLAFTLATLALLIVSMNSYGPEIELLMTFLLCLAVETIFTLAIAISEYSRFRKSIR